MSEDTAYHFRRIWPDRRDGHRWVFANGMVHTDANTRESLKLLIGMMRREKKMDRDVERYRRLRAELPDRT